MGSADGQFDTDVTNVPMRPTSATSTQKHPKFVLKYVVATLIANKTSLHAANPILPSIVHPRHLYVKYDDGARNNGRRMGLSG